MDNIPKNAAGDEDRWNIPTVLSLTVLVMAIGLFGYAMLLAQDRSVKRSALEMYAMISFWLAYLSGVVAMFGQMSNGLKGRKLAWIPIVFCVLLTLWSLRRLVQMRAAAPAVYYENV